MVKEYGSSPATMRPHPVIQSDVLDEDGNLLAADIGITWEGNETFLHGVRVVGSGPPRPAGMGPVMSTPYQPTQEHDRENTSTRAQPPTPLTVPDAEIQLRRPPQEIRQGYRPAAPIQRFNNKSLNWPVWFRHFQGNRPFADQNRGFRSQTFLGLHTEFPILVCDLSTDAIVGTDTLGSILPHTLNIKNGLLFTEGGVHFSCIADTPHWLWLVKLDSIIIQLADLYHTKIK